MTQIQNARKQNEENARANKKAEEQNALRLQQDAAKLAETKRANKAAQREQNRHNRATEQHNANVLKYQRDAMLMNSISSGVGALGSAIGTGVGAALLFNDLPWYAESEQKAEQIFALPANDPLGTNYPLTIDEAMRPEDPNYDVAFQNYSNITANAPGIGTLEIAFALGKNSQKLSPLMKAADSFWTKVNERNGRNSAYESADLMMYQIGLAGHSAFLGFMEKIYSWSYVFSSDNDYVPRGIVEACGVDFDDLHKKGNRLKLHDLILEYRKFLGKYRILPDFYLRDRWYYIARTVLMDTDGTDRQMYHFKPTGFKYVDVSTEPTSMSSIVMPSITSTRWKYDDIESACFTLMESFLSANDVKIMNADIVAYYGEDKQRWIDFDNFEFTQPVLVTVDKTALFQFRNAVPCLNELPNETMELKTLISQAVSTQGGTSVSIIKSDYPDASYYSDIPEKFTIIDVPQEKDWRYNRAGTLIEVTRLVPPIHAAGDFFMTECPSRLYMTIIKPESFNFPDYYYTDDNEMSPVRVRHYRVSYTINLRFKNNSGAGNPTFTNWTSLTGQCSKNLADVTQYAYAIAARTGLYYLPAGKTTITVDITNGDEVTRSSVMSFTANHWDDTVYVPHDLLARASRMIALNLLGAN